MERERERVLLSAHSFSDGHDSKNWTRKKPGAVNNNKIASFGAYVLFCVQALQIMLQKTKDMFKTCRQSYMVQILVLVFDCGP